MSDFKNRLRNLIKETKKTQKDIAKEMTTVSKIEISPQTLSYYVNGREPNYDTLIAIAKYFDVSVDYLTGYSDAKKPENTITIQELGLTDDSVDMIKHLNKIIASAPPDLEEDSRMFIDIFNDLLESRYFVSFLQSIKVLTNPNMGNWSWIPWNDGCVNPFDFELMMKQAGWEKVLKESVEGILEDLYRSTR